MAKRLTNKQVSPTLSRPKRRATDEMTPTLVPVRLTLKVARAVAKLTQTQLAEAADVDFTTIYKIERGGKRDVRASTLQKLAKALRARGVDVQNPLDLLED